MCHWLHTSWHLMSVFCSDSCVALRSLRWGSVSRRPWSPLKMLLARWPPRPPQWPPQAIRASLLVFQQHMGGPHHFKKTHIFSPLSLQLGRMSMKWDWRDSSRACKGLFSQWLLHSALPQPSDFIPTGLWTVKSWPLPSSTLSLWPCCLRGTSRSQTLSCLPIGLDLNRPPGSQQPMFLQIPNPGPGPGPTTDRSAKDVSETPSSVQSVGLVYGQFLGDEG